MTKKKFNNIKEEIVSIYLKPCEVFFLEQHNRFLFVIFQEVILTPEMNFFTGTRLRRLPSLLRQCERVLVTSWGHDPAVVPLSNLLFALNDALTYSPVLAQVSDRSCFCSPSLNIQ